MNDQQYSVQADVIGKTLVSLVLGIGFAASAALAERHRPVVGNQPMASCDLHFSTGAVLSGVLHADTERHRSRGLSRRYEVGTGMLFSWTDEGVRQFWMRDTWVPLSIAFIAADGTLTDIQDMQPNSERVHHSGQPVRLALEVGQGAFQQLGLSIGDRLQDYRCRLPGKTLPDEAVSVALED